jgi:3-methylfumaryl-CoA hydratase
MIHSDQDEQFENWIGSTEVRNDLVTAAPLRLLAASLDREQATPLAGAPIPLPWHWLYFLPSPTSESRTDRHPATSSFLAPNALPRRMWAGRRIRLERGQICMGDVLQRRSVIQGIKRKQGASGALAVIAVRHELTSEAGGYQT